MQLEVLQSHLLKQMEASKDEILKRLDGEKDVLLRGLSEIRDFMARHDSAKAKSAAGAGVGNMRSSAGRWSGVQCKFGRGAGRRDEAGVEQQVWPVARKPVFGAIVSVSAKWSCDVDSEP